MKHYRFPDDPDRTLHTATDLERMVEQGELTSESLVLPFPGVGTTTVGAVLADRITVARKPSRPIDSSEIHGPKISNAQRDYLLRHRIVPNAAINEVTAGHAAVLVKKHQRRIRVRRVFETVFRILLLVGVFAGIGWFVSLIEV